VERAQNAQTVEVLKAAGATMPEIPDKEKNTLLFEYAEKGLTGGVLMALQAGADANHKDRCGKTALDVATNDEVKAALRQHGAKLALLCGRGRPARAGGGPDQGGR